MNRPDQSREGIMSDEQFQGNTITLIVPSRSVNIGLARQTIACLAAQADFTVDEIDDIKMAVSEAVTNAIVHAYGEAEGPITIDATLDRHGLRIDVKDQGRGIPDVPWALEATNTTQPGEHMGLGFAFIKSLMDEVRIDSQPGTGTCVQMIKLFVAARQTPKH
ncbi:MAG TPA: anti-sigma F factor [Limnochordia bacterium]|nr:anti-sigma F factor [Limnochordia bacterium]